ncbi:MAG TPA: ATP-binding protein [Thermoanaerobaculia bacterium]|nr:ATP-binding protein [Thermoanaerobaculia bacterium]
MKREIRLEARPESLKVIRDFIEDSCRGAGVARSDTHDLKVAVDEACSNVVEHGYKGRREPFPLGVLFEADEKKISVAVTDRGTPFDPARAPEPDLEAHWRDRRIGGLGWHLIRRLVDEALYESTEEAGNRLTLIKRRSSPEGKN